jgi:hypothetical protein
MTHFKLTFNDQDKQVTYIGLLTKKSATRVEFETKFGHMNFPVSDLVSLTPTTEDDYNQSQGPVKEKETNVVHTDRPHGPREGNTRMNQAIELYKSLMVNGEHPKRKDVIDKFVTVIGMTPAGASTYQNTVKNLIK